MEVQAYRSMAELAALPDGTFVAYRFAARSRVVLAVEAGREGVAERSPPPSSACPIGKRRPNHGADARSPAARAVRPACGRCASTLCQARPGSRAPPAIVLSINGIFFLSS